MPRGARSLAHSWTPRTPGARWLLRAGALLGLATSLAGCLRGRGGAQAAAVKTTRNDMQAAESAQKPSNAHMYVSGRFLYDRCGERVVLRGVNKMVIWTDPEGATFPEIAKTGANTVRIVWTIKDDRGPAALDNVLTKAEEARLIPVIELHDATGSLNRVPELVDFWTTPAVLDVLRRHEASLLLNIGNEPGGGGVDADEFVAVYRNAISRLRQAGLMMPLVIDAPRWGQDIDLLQEAAPRLLSADPEHDLLFSAHLWWPQGAGTTDPGSTQRTVSELEESADIGLPLIVGEFAHAGVGCSRSIDYETILDETQKHDIGWLACSRGPGNKDCDEMDMTEDGRFETLRGWGLEVAVTDPNSIRKTSRIRELMLRGECPRMLGAPRP